MLGIAVLPKAKSAGDKNTWTYFYHTSSKQEGGSIPHARTRLRATPSPRGFTPKTPKNSATFAQQNVGKFAFRSVLPTVANDQHLPSGGFAGAQPRLAQNAAPAHVLPAYSRRSLPKTPKNSATFAQQNVGKFAVRSVLPTVANDQLLPSGGFAGAQPRLAQNAAPARVLPAYSRRSLFPGIFPDECVVPLVTYGNNRYRGFAKILYKLDIRARVFRERVV